MPWKNGMKNDEMCYEDFTRALKYCHNYGVKHIGICGDITSEGILYDLSNYPSAEEIVRRQILDYHVNDPDGILLLGDIMLEWGTEKDPTKLEEAKEQYLKEGFIDYLSKPIDLNIHAEDSVDDVLEILKPYIV